MVAFNRGWRGQWSRCVVPESLLCTFFTCITAWAPDLVSTGDSGIRLRRHGPVADRRRSQSISRFQFSLMMTCRIHLIHTIPGIEHSATGCLSG